MTAQPGSARIALLTGGFHLILSVCLDGHVPSTGLDPPADPVLVYRNDSEKGSRPSVKPAQDFHLIWRQNGRSPVTMWEPLPPQGYRALGTVVVPHAEQPGSKEVLCVREDLCSKAGIFDSTIWKFEPPIMQVHLLKFCCLSAVSGKCQGHVLQVDSQVLSVRPRPCIRLGTAQPIQAYCAFWSMTVR